MYITKRFSATIFAFWMSVFMALIMSGILVALHSGINATFLTLWSSEFLLALSVAFPATLLITPLAGYLTNIMTNHKA
jgi:uncharacterized protein DUF2798